MNEVTDADALPPLRFTVVTAVVPSKNVTLPVACDGETEAESVTESPNAMVVGVTVSVVVVDKADTEIV